MKTLSLVCLCLGIIGFIQIGPALAANTANQTVTIQVGSVNEIAVSGNPGALTVSTATAGSQPDAATDNSTSYNITTNGTGKKITGALNSAMPAGTTLSVSLAAPAGGSSSGAVSLTTSTQNLVTGVSQVASSGHAITYILSATVAAGEVASTTRTVTLTLTDGP